MAEKEKEQEQEQLMVMSSRVKDFIISLNMKSTSDIADAVNEEVKVILTRAAKRCKENGRQTMKPCDI